MPAVLLCDDEIHVRSILERRFRSAGWEVHTASDGREAVEASVNQRLDLIVIDFQMPVMTGAEAAVTIYENEQTRSIPVIMLSGQSHRMDDETRQRTGIVSVIPKPFSAVQVLDAANDAIANADEDSEAA